MFFNPPAEGIVDVAVAFSMVQLFDTHFGQAVFGIVMVILGTAGGLFAAGTSVFVVAVFQSAEAEQLIKADLVLIAFFFAASGHVVVVIALSLSVVFFAYQPVQIVVAVVAVQYDIRQDACYRTFGLFFGQTAGAVILKTGIHFALAAQGSPVQMSGTIIQFVDGTSVRQGGANELAGSVVLEICDNFNVCQQVQNMLLFYFHK